MSNSYVPCLSLFSLLFCSLHLLQSAIVCIRNRLLSRWRSIPSPPIPFWKIFSVGHNILHLLLTADSFEAAQVFNKWREEYGPILQLRGLLGEKAVYIFSEKAIREVNISKQRFFKKSWITRTGLVSITGENGILVADGDAHLRLRRAIAPSMHHNALVAVEDVFFEQGRMLAERLGDFGHSGGPVLKEVRAAAFAVIFDTCLGKNAVSPKEMMKLQEAYFEVFPEPPMFTLRNWILRTVFWFLDEKHFSYKEHLKEYIRGTIEDICSQRVSQCEEGCKEASTPLVSLMVDPDMKEKLGNREMVETVMSFLVAGQVTSSISVCWALYLLARFPKWQTLLVDELQKWSPSDGLDALDRLPLLDRIVRETIRLYPPLFYLNRTAAEAVELDGFMIPKNTTIRIPVLAIHRSRKIWGADVNEFNPDRFLSQELLRSTRMYWCAFLFGSKGCVGQRFALLEIKAFVAQTIMMHKVTAPTEVDSVPKCSGPFATPTGLKLYFEERESH